MTVPCQRSPLLTDWSHGFFGRQGGVSEGVFASLNTGPGSGDARDAVTENRRRCQAVIGADGLFTGYQTHSSIARLVVDASDPLAEGDAWVTTTPGLAVGVLTADCVPVLFAADGMVGAAHAGWRGSLRGILEATIELMVAQGAARHDIRCAIGPSLRSPLFEVGQDLIDEVCDVHPAAQRFFHPAENGKADYDHIGYVRCRLTESGLEPGHIGDVGGNTLATPEMYFSYRAMQQAGEPAYGRNLSAITCPRS